MNIHLLSSNKGMIVVAAADASIRSKALADYICTGTDDQLKINTAIQALPDAGNVDIKNMQEQTTKNQGGKVVLSEGTFNISGKIDIHGVDNITIEGQGPSTVINNLATDGGHAIEAINPAAISFPTLQGQNRITVKNLLVMGNSQSGDGIHLEETNYETITNVFSQSNGGYGVHIKALTENGGASNKIITNCQLQFNGESGLYLEGVHETLIGQTHIEENDNYGIEIKDCVDIKITGCNIEDTYGEYEIYATNLGDLGLSNSVVEGDIYVECENGGSNYITGCETGKLNLIVGTSGYFALTNNHTGDVTLTGTSGGHFYISNSYASKLIVNTGTNSKVFIDNFEAALIDNISATEIHIANSYMGVGIAPKTVTANVAKIINTQIETSQNITFTIESLMINGGTTIKSINGTPTVTVNMANNSSMVTEIGNCVLQQVNLAVNGYSNQYHRVILNGSNIRLSGATITLTDVNIIIAGNTISGNGTMAFVGCDSVNINGNTFILTSAFSVTFDDECAESMLFTSNTITQASNLTLIDLSENLVIKNNIGLADN